MRDDSVNCNVLQQMLRERRELTKTQAAHLRECEGCMDAWLTAALDQKPEVAIPSDFAARVAAIAPARQENREAAKASRHWGVISAMAVVTVLLVICFESPGPANSTPSSWIGPLFLFLVTAEIAGLALWLGPRWTGR
jgi:hypothetical protein